MRVARFSYDCVMVNPIGANYMQRTSVEAKQRVRTFYGEVLGWGRQEINPSFEVYSCSDEITYGVQYVEEGVATLTDDQFRSATWMSIRADDRESLVARIKEFGVHVIEEMSDDQNFFFQAPGGQVYVC